MSGKVIGGWFIGDFPSIPHLKGMLQTIRTKPRLVQVLTQLLGSEHRLLSRSEIYVDRTTTWHMDGLFGPYALYNRHMPFLQRHCAEIAELIKRNPNRNVEVQPFVRKLASERLATRRNANTMAPKQLLNYWSSYCSSKNVTARPHGSESPEWDVGFEQTEVAWLQSESGERQRIVTVAVYLQDHWEDPNGLSIAPRTHDDEERWFHHGLGRGRPRNINESSEMVTLRSGKGDAVVFDARLLHRGMHPPWAIPNLLRKLDLPQRTSISLSFGRKNSFSEAFDRGFAMRGRVYSRNSSICRNQREVSQDNDIAKYVRRVPNVYSKCVYDAVRADLRERPLLDDAHARQVDDDEALGHTPFLEQLGRRLNGGHALRMQPPRNRPTPGLPKRGVNVDGLRTKTAQTKRRPE